MPQVVDARVLRDAMARYLEALRAHREEIDSLNVFPVPDGDTGTNMLLTQQAVEEALVVSAADDLAVVGEAISRAALMGARGNSGVILSQVLRGLCTRLCREARAGPRDLAEALTDAAKEARRAVAEPVEGTMLSVLRDSAEAALDACRAGAGCDEVADAALAASLDSLERTPEALPALAEAGVVDAGARGVVLLLDALVSAVRGVPLQVGVGPRGPVGDGSPPARPAGSTYGFEVMYLFECDDVAVPSLRERLGGIGDSVVVVGGGGLYTVHVHTDDPRRAVQDGVAAGRPREIRVTSLDEQVEACLAGEARAVRAGEPPARTAMVAVVPAEGVARLFRSLGAEALVAERPSVDDLVVAISATGGHGVLVLPNDPQGVDAAERAAEAAAGARVVPTGSVPEGLAVATAVIPDDVPEKNLSRARDAAGAVASGRALRGQVVGAVRAIHLDHHQIATLIAGRDVPDEEAEAEASAVRETFPSLEVEWHRGGQVDPPFLIGIE
jgi:DAK2 domain fusion protein YloV